MRTKNRASARLAAGVVYLCAAFAAAVYAVDLSSAWKAKCYNCDDYHPVTLSDGTIAKSQNDCCENECIYVNSLIGGDAGDCELDCENYTP